MGSHYPRYVKFRRYLNKSAQILASLTTLAGKGISVGRDMAIADPVEKLYGNEVASLATEVPGTLASFADMVFTLGVDKIVESWVRISDSFELPISEASEEPVQIISHNTMPPHQL